MATERTSTDNDDDAASPDDDDSSSDDDVIPPDDDNDDNLAGLIWISIPAGTFWMGCVPQDTDCYTGELPRHLVTLPAYQIAKTDVTQKQYEAVTGTDPIPNYPCPECPVEQVRWQEAVNFCEAVGGRLPTEAEWENAARAGTETIYICGDDPACLDSAEWYRDNTEGNSAPVCGKTPNAWGLCDMAGNVSQWVHDWWGYYGSELPQNNPQGPATGFVRVLRGGNNVSWARETRPSYRDGNVPGINSIGYGFRCARDVDDDDNDVSPSL